MSGATKDVEVFAHSKSGFGNDLPLVAPALLNELFGERVTPNLIRIAVEDGADPSEVARRINGTFLTNGLDAQSFREITSENVAQQQSFFRLMQGYLALGLVVGIAGLGVVMIRAVRERRRQIGVLRSLGFPAAAVRRAFVAESAFVAAEGISIGVILALIVAWRIDWRRRPSAERSKFSVSSPCSSLSWYSAPSSPRCWPPPLRLSRPVGFVRPSPSA